MSVFPSAPLVLSRSNKYTHPILRRTILSLVTREGQVTRYRLAEVLGVSRMTADRISEQLVAEGLLTEIKGPDPIHGRISRLLTLSPDPRLLLMDVDPHEPLMHAYCYEAQRLRKLTLEFHLTKDTAENESVLRRGAELLWSLPPQTMWLHLSRGRDHHPYWIGECEALAHALFYHPKLMEKRSVLCLRWGTELHGALYVREQTEDLWFVPSGGCFSRPLPPVPQDNEQATLQSITPLIASNQALVTPDAILVERDHTILREKSSHEIPYHPLPSSGVTIKALSGLPQDKQAIHEAVNAEVLMVSDPVPLWVSGAIYRQRELRWLGDEAADIPI